ncbi:hypothetical protein GCM10029964_023550 [Kibdelosporangium lantanae]
MGRERGQFGKRVDGHVHGPVHPPRIEGRAADFPSGRIGTHVHPQLAGETANRLLTTAVANLTRAYPIHWTRHITGPDQLVPHEDLHPVFAGSYDWHSCVHQTWLAARLLRSYPDLPHAALARDTLTSLITPRVARSKPTSSPATKGPTGSVRTAGRGC